MVLKRYKTSVALLLPKYTPKFHPPTANPLPSKEEFTESRDKSYRPALVVAKSRPAPPQATDAPEPTV